MQSFPKADIRHVAETASHVSVDREGLVEKLELAEYLHSPRAGSLSCYGITCQGRRWQCVPLSESFIFDEINFMPDPLHF
jgi:hypothetical protein